MNGTESEEEREQLRRSLDTAIMRTENVVSLIRQSFKGDDFDMVREMAVHLNRDADDIHTKVTALAGGSA